MNSLENYLVDLANLLHSAGCVKKVECDNISQKMQFN